MLTLAGVKLPKSSMSFKCGHMKAKNLIVAQKMTGTHLVAAVVTVVARTQVVSNCVSTIKVDSSYCCC